MDRNSRSTQLWEKKVEQLWVGGMQARKGRTLTRDSHHKLAECTASSAIVMCHLSPRLHTNWSFKCKVSFKLGHVSVLYLDKLPCLRVSPCFSVVHNIDKSPVSS